MSYPSASARSSTRWDLRSDTVTRPDRDMRAAMAAAEVGDDVYGEDPTVARLEAEIAGLFGKEAALLLPSGTQSNLVAVLSHCGRGDEVIVGRGYHVECAEARGASVLGGVAIEPVETREDMGLDAGVIAAAVKPHDPHYPSSRLLCIENTVGGRAVPLAVHDEAIEAGRAARLAIHLDGARIFNAALALGAPPARLARGVDTVSVCLSKGLGTPAGSVLTGPSELIDRARRWRKMLGGGMRQAGILAAAGLHALARNVDRLADDHARAARLREGLAALPGLDVDMAPGQTNMVWLRLPPGRGATLAHALGAHGVTVGGRDAERLRLVVHRDVDDDGIDAALRGFAAFAAPARAA